MTITMYVVLVVSFVILTFIVWRLFSRRVELPCPSWLAWMVELDNPFTKTNRANSIIECLYLEPGMKVLDAGCGPGRLTIPVAKKVGVQGEVVAVDIQEGMLQRVQEKAQKADLRNIRFLQAGVGTGQLEHSYYDRALLITVLGEIPDRTSALKEIFDALKPGGMLVVTEVIFDPHFQSRKTVLRLAQAVGFQQKNIFGNRLAYTMQLEKPVRI